tara:strand:- start:944 stop:1930 length:987 start_codon:yes stop_codon:yes gene_type:complete
MKKFKVFVARKIPEAGITLLKKAGLDVEINKDENKILSKKELIRKIKDKNALLSLLTDKIDKEVLSSAPNLKIIANYAVGFDNIDVKAASEKGITVTNTPGVLTETVAEHTFALMMASARRIVESDKFTKQGKYKAWGPLLFLGHDLKDKTLGIIGLGRIGSAVAKRAVKGMGMKLIYNKRHRDKPFEKKYGAEFASLNTLLKKSDFISIHVPLTPKTRHLISSKEFKLMKNNAILVNTSRGPIVDEKALVNALKNKKIAGAALDVFECEPEITCSTSSITQLRDLDNVILTPHIASASVETRSKMAEMAALSIVDFAKGKLPKNIVK